MKLLSKDLRHGEVKVKVESPEDLWHLSQIVDSKDFISGKTTRKIKVNEEADASKKKVFLSIEVERVEFTSDALRISGKVTEGPEDVSRGSYHTFSITPGDSVKLKKHKWYGYQKDRLDDALKEKQSKVLVCVFDREEAITALVKSSGIEVLAKLQGDVVRKRMKSGAKDNFFQELAKKLEEYDKRFDLDVIIIASPAFWKEELLKVLKADGVKKKLVPATSGGVSERAIAEVLRRDEVRNALRQERTSKELLIVETVLESIAKDAAVVYGFKRVKEACAVGAVKDLLVTDGFIRLKKEDGSFEELGDVLKSVNDQRGKVHIISSKHEGGKKLKGLGGMAALLRYKLV